MTKRHGYSGTPEYRAWANMKNRCLNPNTRDYHYYGGRGITIHDDWLKSFTNFLTDVGKRPAPEFSLDRIDNDKGYYPDNVRWTTKRTQVINRRDFSNTITGCKGVALTRSGKYQARIKNDGKLTSLGTFPTLREASIAYNAAAIALFGSDAILNK